LEGKEQKNTLVLQCTPLPSQYHFFFAGYQANPPRLAQIAGYAGRAKAGHWIENVSLPHFTILNLHNAWSN